MATPNPQNTHMAYGDNDSWTSARGASKFIYNAVSTKDAGYNQRDRGCVFNGFKPTTSGTDFIVRLGDADDQVDSHCFIEFEEYGFLCWSEGKVDLQIEAADQNFPRRSLIIGYVDLSMSYVSSDHEIESPGTFKIVEVQGSSADTFPLPTQAQIDTIVGAGNPYIVFAEIKVNANATALTNADITNKIVPAMISPNLSLDTENSYVAGFYDAGNGNKTRIVVTGPEGNPNAIPGITTIWLRRKS